MNKEIRLYNALGELGTLRDFLQSFTNKEIQNYLVQTFDTMAVQVRTGIVPTDTLTLLFDLASIIYELEIRDEDRWTSDFKQHILDILIKKTEDYNADRLTDQNFRLDDARIEYFPFGHWSYLQMLHTKINRIVTVLNNRDGQTNFESVADSLLDLGAYSIFYYSYLVELDTDD